MKKIFKLKMEERKKSLIQSGETFHIIAENIKEAIEKVESKMPQNFEIVEVEYAIDLDEDSDLIECMEFYKEEEN